jgi:hypothetical protein
VFDQQASTPGVTQLVGKTQQIENEHGPLDYDGGECWRVRMTFDSDLTRFSLTSRRSA